MLYGVEINEPYQVNAEFKLRCLLDVTDEGGFNWTSKPERAFATEDKELAETLVSTIPESWDAQVVPVEEGKEPVLSSEELIKAFAARARTRAKQAREIR
jgi:hypothetical protein